MIDPRIGRTITHVHLMARAMLEREGNQAFTWGTLSEEARVARRTLSQRWGTTDNLLAEMLISTIRPEIESSGSEEENLKNVLRGVRDHLRDTANMRILLSVAAAEKGKGDESASSTIDEFTRRWTCALQKAVPSLSERHCDLLIGPIVFQECFTATAVTDEMIDELVALGLSLNQDAPPVAFAHSR